MQRLLILIPRAWIRRRKELDGNTLKHKCIHGLA